LAIDDTNDVPDERLVEETIAGSDDAFGLLVRRHKQRVIRLVARFARDNDDLEDISQDVFIKAYEKLETYRREAPFEHWLSRIAIRTCYDALRKRKNEKMNVPLQAIHQEIEDTSGALDGAAAEARGLISWGVARLRPDERLVITLLELEEKTVREVATLTGWSETNVKVRAFRARQKLKDLLETGNGR
jgi:RNA polymerase sigma-70 factor (ECF subfamily)